MRPFAYTRFLILATARKLYPFAVLGIGGIRAYFASREDAETYIEMAN